MAKASEVTPEWMLAQITEEGQQAGSDYNDSEEVAGWFGFTVTTVGSKAVLEATFEDEDNAKVTHRWWLTPQ